jgi:alpha-beta hydrolase superfamily lysophospholipase
MVTGVVVASSVGLSVIAVAGGVVAALRKIVTPERRRRDDLRILGHDPAARTVTLTSTADTRLPGRYSLWFAGGAGHARLAEVLSDDGRAVVRRVERVTAGDLRRARSGRIGGWLWSDPGEAGLEAEEVRVVTEVGPAPAWLVPAEGGTAGPWMIGVHGRGVTRAETIRSVPVFRRNGHTALLVSYRNDGEAPRSSDGRYALGDDEWADVESAMAYALDHGATSLVLMGWSMGGAVVLQAVTRSALAHRVDGVVLESPVVDWRTTLRFQGAAMHVPGAVQGLVLRLLQSPVLSRLSGRRRPIDLDRLDLVAGSDALDVPVLLLHSDDDGFVPSTASHALAAARPDIVRLEVFDTARHTKLYNLDPERFDRVIDEWLARLPRASGRRARSARPPAAD